LCTGDTPVGWDAGAARLWQKRQRPPDLIFAAMATEPVVNAGSGEPIRGHLQHPMDFVRQRIAGAGAEDDGNRLIATAPNLQRGHEVRLSNIVCAVEQGLDQREPHDLSLGP